MSGMTTTTTTTMAHEGANEDARNWLSDDEVSLIMAILDGDEADQLMDQLDFMLSREPGEPGYELRADAVKFLDELMRGNCGDTEVDAEVAT